VPDVVEPGTRLVSRYRLEEHLEELAGATDERAVSTYWRAHDELLDRPVGVALIRSDAPHAAAVLSAARLAATISDARFLRVLDASEVDGFVYVVTEWVRATNLADLLADGPLSPGEARDLAAAVAGALAGAHEQGIAHLTLAPEHVLRTAHGQVKVAGLGIDAAARGHQVDDPDHAAEVDGLAAAAVLYAALTARWPGPGDTALPPAPREGDLVCSPRQVRAHVPDDLDDIAARAFGRNGRHDAAPVRTAADLHAALSAAHVTSRIPVVRETQVRPEPAGPSGRVGAYDDQAPRRARSRAATLAWTFAALVLVVGLALFGGQLVMTALDGDDGGPSTGASDEQPGEPDEGGRVRHDVVAASTLDPPPDGNGDENGDRAQWAVDDDPSTAWPTKTYNDQFGGPASLKDGVGLVLDLGAVRRVDRVAVTVAGGATDLEVRTGREIAEDLDGFEVFDSANNADGRVVLSNPDAVQARYVLVWLTGLPTTGEGRYRGEVAQVTVRG
jgi:hypothetical protein